jgi:hypothetical protein
MTAATTAIDVTVVAVTLWSSPSLLLQLSSLLLPLLMLITQGLLLILPVLTGNEDAEDDEADDDADDDADDIDVNGNDDAEVARQNGYCSMIW